MANIALSIIGAILAAAGGFISGIGAGINYAIMQIVSALTSYVDNIPVYGPLLSSEIQSNVQAQLSSDLSGYYLLGLLLFIPGIQISLLFQVLDFQHFFFFLFEHIFQIS